MLIGRRSYSVKSTKMGASIFVGLALLRGLASAQVPTYQYGTVRFTQTTVQDGKSLVAHSDYAWDGAAYVVQKQTVQADKGPVHISEVSTPQGNYEIIEGKDIRVVNFGGSKNQDDEPFLTVCPGASMPLGAIPKMAKPLGAPGMYEIGSVSYRVTPGQKGIPTRIERLGQNGEVSATYTFNGNVSNGAGGHVPQEAVYAVNRTGIDYRRVFQFEAANLGAKPALEAYLTNWNQPGFSIADHRVSPEVVWTSEELTKLNGGDPKITPEQLLKLSQRRSGYFQKSIKQGEKVLARKNQQQNTVGWMALGVVVLIGATYAIPALLRRRAKAKR